MKNDAKRLLEIIPNVIGISKKSSRKWKINKPIILLLNKKKTSIYLFAIRLMMNGFDLTSYFLPYWYQVPARKQYTFGLNRHQTALLLVPSYLR